jgi:hypothetical protein
MKDEVKADCLPFIPHPSAFILIFSGIPPRADAIKGLSGPVRVVSLPQFLESKP